MSLIEQAAKRLEQLRQAGVEIPEDIPGPVLDVPPPKEPVVSPKPDPMPLVAEPASTGSGVQSKRIELDLEALAAANVVCPQSPRSRIADEYRVIKRPLIGNAMGKGASPVANGNLIMVTSALPGEGKTFTAVNLAMSIAMELDNTVMLVDADVARPSVLNALGLPPARGLLDVLVEDSVDLSEVLLKTNVEKLSLLPAGTQHPRATELLASDAMARLLDDMANRYSDRIIIFDSPPLLLTTESRVLASHMGQVVVVVQAERTSHSDVKQALATIENCPVRLMVLNKSSGSSSEGYGYGYGYGYGA